MGKAILSQLAGNGNGKKHFIYRRMVRGIKHQDSIEYTGAHSGRWKSRGTAVFGWHLSARPQSSTFTTKPLQTCFLPRRQMYTSIHTNRCITIRKKLQVFYIAMINRRSFVKVASTSHNTEHCQSQITITRKQEQHPFILLYVKWSGFQARLAGSGQAKSTSLESISGRKFHPFER